MTTTDHDIDYYAAVHIPGHYLRFCHNPRCSRGLKYFSTTEPRALYCCETCQKSARNRRNYARRKARQSTD